MIHQAADNGWWDALRFERIPAALKAVKGRCRNENFIH